MAIGHPGMFRATGATGATGPTASGMNWPGANGPSGPHSPMFRLIPEIRSVKPSIVQHRRLHENDLCIAPSELIVSFFRNRLILVMPDSAILSQSLEKWSTQYELWLDENITGLYTIGSPDNDRKLLLSFEIEADMMQFAMVFR